MDIITGGGGSDLPFDFRFQDRDHGPEGEGYDQPQPCEEEEGSTGGRRLCWDGCGRPIRSCICPYLPPDPINTATQILILHHPHELRQKLSTVPTLTRCLRSCRTVPGRRLLPGSSPLLDSLHHGTAASTKALFLFPTIDPSSPATDLAEWTEESRRAGSCEQVVLVVFDGTWRHAREMATASLPFLSGFATQVELGGGIDAGVEGDSTFESELVLRKEPFRGCVSTMEAVARALRVLEPDGSGVEVEERLLSVLRAMVRVQFCHLKAVQPRLRLKKTKKNKKKGSVEDGVTAPL